jgi:hypothetical protein
MENWGLLLIAIGVITLIIGQKKADTTSVQYSKEGKALLVQGIGIGLILSVVYFALVTS